MGKKALIDLLDNVDEQEYDILYRIILKFVKEAPPAPDEIKAIELGEQDYENGDVYSHEDAWS